MKRTHSSETTTFASGAHSNQRLKPATCGYMSYLICVGGIRGNVLENAGEHEESAGSISAPSFPSMTMYWLLTSSQSFTTSLLSEEYRTTLSSRSTAEQWLVFGVPAAWGTATLEPPTTSFHIGAITSKGLILHKNVPLPDDLVPVTLIVHHLNALVDSQPKSNRFVFKLSSFHICQD